MTLPERRECLPTSLGANPSLVMPTHRQSDLMMSDDMIGGEITDRGGGIVSLVLHAEEDINACLDWPGCSGLRTKVGDSLTADCILLVVEGDDNLGGLEEMFSGIVPGEEEVHDKEHKVHEGQ